MDNKLENLMTLKLKNTNLIKIKTLFQINHIDINKIIVSNRFPFGNQNLKCFIGYKDSEKIRPLNILCPQMIIYKINFDGNGHIYFLIKFKKILLNIWKF